jgi:hypothetical protein
MNSGNRFTEVIVYPFLESFLSPSLMDRDPENDLLKEQRERCSREDDVRGTYVVVPLDGPQPTFCPNLKCGGASCWNCNNSSVTDGKCDECGEKNPRPFTRCQTCKYIYCGRCLRNYRECCVRDREERNLSI